MKSTNMKKFFLGLSLFVFVISASCGSHRKNNSNKNYLEGAQAEIDRNVQQLEKRQEADERKIDVSDYEANRPK